MTEAIVALFTLAILEIILGIDNIIFIGIVAGKLPPERRAAARRYGLLLAMGTRILLLLGITWVMKLEKPLFYLPDVSDWFPMEHKDEVIGISGKDIILILGGLFLIAKSVHEIHNKLEGPEEHSADGKAAAKAVTFGSVLTQIAIIDIIFSLDSVITAVGMTARLQPEWAKLPVMIAAVMAAVGVMMVAAGPINDFVDRHPTFKILALAFLILIGVVLVAEGFGQHLSKGYIYFAMAFSVTIELLNMRLRKVSDPVHLHGRPSAK